MILHTQFHSRDAEGVVVDEEGGAVANLESARVAHRNHRRSMLERIGILASLN